MPLRRLIPLTLTAVVATLGASAPVASAAYFKGEAIDSGPIKQVGAVAVARDGSGGVTYVKSDGGVDHVFVSRLVDGAFQTPERVDPGLVGAGSAPVITAADTGKLMVAFVNGGQVFTAVRLPAAPAFTAPQGISAGAAPSIDLSINGGAYVSYTTSGASAADVRVAHLTRNTTTFTVLPGILDIDPARDAGAGPAAASHLVVSADGTAVVVWGEAGHVYARRVFDNRLSAVPQDLSISTLDGHAADPSSAVDPRIAIEDDSSFAWVTFRQRFDDNLMHTVARRLVGSQFEAPVNVDGSGYGGDQATSSAIAMNNRGTGLAVSGTASKRTAVAQLHDDHFFPAVLVNQANNVAPQPVATFANNNDGYAAWMQGNDPTVATVHAVAYNIDPAKRTVAGPEQDTEISNPDFGPVDVNGGLVLAGDRAGDAAAVFVQGTGAGRRLVAAGFDREPARFTISSTSNYRKNARATLAWSDAFNLWGPLTYAVTLDGQPVGQTRSTSLELGAPLTDGDHTLSVTATDRRGQTTTVAKPGLIRVDTVAPKLSFSLSGAKAAGGRLTLSTKAADASPGSGLQRVVIDFGDGSARVKARRAQHRYAKKGKYKLRVSATDEAGNSTVVYRTITVKKK